MCRNLYVLQTSKVAYFQRKIQLSGFSAYPDGLPCQIIRISGVLLYICFYFRTYNWSRWMSGRYSDWAGRSGDRIRWGTRFSAPVATCRGVHSAPYKMSIGSFPGVKGLARGVNHTPRPSAEFEGSVDLCLYFRSVPSRQVIR